MSSSTSALKASKSIVDSYISSTERSDLTTSFTENTPTLSDSFPQKNIIKTILGIVKHPKFKWIVIAILLCMCVFVYFKSQNKHTKQANKEQIEDTRLDITQDKDGRPILVDLKEKEYMDKISQLEQKEKQFQEKINTNNIQQASQNIQQVSQRTQQQQAASHSSQQAAQQAAEAQRVQQAVQQVSQRAQQEAQRSQQEAQRSQQEAQRSQQVHQTIEQESESSEEVFIENENVMNHNLTREEMNAIDKQLEDININNMGYESN